MLKGKTVFFNITKYYRFWTISLLKTLHLFHIITVAPKIQEFFMNMKKWKEDIIMTPKKKAMPVLSFPCVQLMGITVKQLISDSTFQAAGMKKIYERTDSLASLSMMDLSVEAEAFG